MIWSKGFTLLELIVVILIISILGTFGFSQYQNMLEKGRAAEAKVNLGMLRKLQIAYYWEHGTYATFVGSTDELKSGLPVGTGVPSFDCSGVSAGNPNVHYFMYLCFEFGGDWRCIAMRCAMVESLQT